MLDARFVRFLVVGVGNTLFGYAVFALIYAASGSHRAAIILATIIGVVFNFFTTGRLVFDSRSLAKLVPFVLGYGIVLALNLALVEILLRLGVNAFLAQLISLPAVVGASYVINARLVFRPDPDRGGTG